MDYLSNLSFAIYGVSAVGVVLGTFLTLKIYSAVGAR